MPRKLITELFAEVEASIRSGNFGHAHTVLRSVPLKTIPRPEIARFAELSRRTNLPALAIRALNRIVRPGKNAVTKPASDLERAEYGAALLRIGAVAEALAILGAVEKKRAPEGLLYQAFALISQWRYSEAQTSLSDYLATSPEPYQRLIARVNRSAALIYTGQLSFAEEELRECQDQAAKLGASRLAGNISHLMALQLIQRDKLDPARALISKALALPDASMRIDSLLGQKWLAVCDLIASKGNDESRRGLLDVRKEAARARQWETVRDIDAQIAVRTKSHADFLRVYFGTPFEGYRSMLLADFGAGANLPPDYLWATLSSTPLLKGEFDLFLGRDRRWGHRDRLRPGLLLKLLHRLASDFYRPFRPAALFSELFPDEFHNPRSSPNRIHALVLRLRSWLRASSVPLEIEQTDGAYRIGTSRSYGVRVRLEAGIQNQNSFLLEKLKCKLSKEPFESTRAAEILGLSVRSARRILLQAASEGRLRCLGARNNRRYVFQEDTAIAVSRPAQLFGPK